MTVTISVERVCAAIVRDDRILMVRHVEGDRDFWTLPGGGAEAGETRRFSPTWRGST